MKRKLLTLATASLLFLMLPIVFVYANPGTERLAPDGETFALTELTGAYTDVADDPDSPDGNWLPATGNNVNTAVRASFPTPTGNPTVGVDLQEFRVLVRQYDETQSGTPDARIELWENGGLIRAGSDTPVPDGGIVLSFTWNANELATADGSQVEINVVGTKAGGSPSKRNAVEVGAIEWNVDYTTGTAPNFPTGFRLVRTGDTTLEASWDPVSGVNNYWLMVSTVEYPDNPNGDFTVVYSANSTSIDLDGYELDSIVFYFSLWSQVNPFSNDAAQAQLGGETLAGEVANMALIMQGGIMLIPLILMSVLAFWRFNAVLFMLTAGIAVMVGFYMPDIFAIDDQTIPVGLAMGLMFVAYSLVCVGFAFVCIFRNERKDEE